MISSDTLNLAIGLMSIFLGLLAAGLAIWFFVLTKRTEKEVSNSLVEIKTQATSLERLTGKWMDRFTRYFTDQKPQSATETIPEILTVLVKISQGLTSSMKSEPQKENLEGLFSELISTYIAIYYYTALTNYFAQGYLPHTFEFDEKNQFHQLVKRVLDTSQADFRRIEDIILAIDKNRIAANPLAHLLEEAITHWSRNVKSASDVFVAQSQQG